MARIRSRTLVLLVALSGVAALLATPARAAGKDASPEGDGIRIVTPADKTQLPVAGNGTVLVELHDRLETSSLHVVLSNPTAGRMVDLTARLVKGEHSATASFGPADLAQGITRVTATASREHGHTVRRAVSEFSWEPGIDTTAADRCELLGQDRCLLPFPSDRFTVADPSTDTGRRVSFNLESMPANIGGAHMDPTEWNRSDGFSPGAMIIAHIPGLDLGTTGAAPVTDIARSLDDNAPIVLVNAETERLFRRESVPGLKAIERPALRKLDMLDAAPDLRTLATLPGNRLERLKGDRKDQYSIRINDRWRICFEWRDGHAYEVEIVDYH